jgi:hypothetical protein
MSETVSFRFSKGEEVKDSLSGFTGIVVYQVSNLTGCNNYGVEAKPKTKTEKGEQVLIDENRLVSTGKNIYTLPEAPKVDVPKPAKVLEGKPGPIFTGKPSHAKVTQRGFQHISNKPKIK